LTNKAVGLANMAVFEYCPTDSLVILCYVSKGSVGAWNHIAVLLQYSLCVYLLISVCTLHVLCVLSHG